MSFHFYARYIYNNGYKQTNHCHNIQFKINKQHRANRKETEENKEIKNVIVNSKFMKEIMKLKEVSEMRCSF